MRSRCCWTTIFLFSVSRGDAAKVAVFAAKVGLLVGGVAAMATPAGPAIAIGEGVAVSSGALAGGGTLVATGILHGSDYARSVPFRVGSYPQKLDFLMDALGAPASAVPHTAYFKELVVYRRVRELIAEQYGELDGDRALTRCASLRSLMDLFDARWDALFPLPTAGSGGGEAAGIRALVAGLDAADRRLFAALVWVVAVLHEARRLLMRDFTLHVCGTKEVGKSTLVREVFGARGAAAGCGVDDTTLTPTAYTVRGIAGARVIDHPGSDDLHAVAGRIAGRVYSTASHCLLLATMQELKRTDFARLLCALQSSGTRYTVVLSRADELVADYPTPEELELEVSKAARALNLRLAAMRAALLAPESAESADVDASELQLPPDTDPALIHDEDCGTWLICGVCPRPPVRVWLDAHGATLSDFGVLDLAAFRGALQAALRDAGATEFCFPPHLPCASPPPRHRCAAPVEGCTAASAGAMSLDALIADLPTGGAAEAPRRPPPPAAAAAGAVAVPYRDERGRFSA